MTALSRAAVMACAAAALSAPMAAGPDATLKDAFKGSFLVGVAINRDQATGANARDQAIVLREFNSTTPENEMKWERIHPEPGRYDFAPADAYVDFATSHGMFVVGHNLVWHDMTPSWVFQDDAGKPLSRGALIERMHDHIRTVVGRYRGRVRGWDVVNEAVGDEGGLRQSPWYRIIGPDYLAYAYTFAHEADPEAELYYNDYGIEAGPKHAGALALLRHLRELGIPVSAVGLQGHYRMDWPSTSQLDQAIRDFAALGLKVMITELDIDVLPKAPPVEPGSPAPSARLHPELDPYRDAIPEQLDRALADRYAELFRVFVADRRYVSRVTFWCVDDSASWLNDWPVRGRTAYPLLFDRTGKPKPAFRAVLMTAPPEGH